VAVPAAEIADQELAARRRAGLQACAPYPPVTVSGFEHSVPAISLPAWPALRFA
jgi:hypothetical protein